MEKDILENNFETIYKEYKEYESVFELLKEEVNKEKDVFKERVVSGTDSDDTLSEILFNLSIKPLQSAEDLRILRDRLISVYDAYKITIDFPESIKEEIKKLKRPTQAYRIHNGKQIEIDKVSNDKYKEEVKKRQAEIIASMKSQ